MSVNGNSLPPVTAQTNSLTNPAPTPQGSGPGAPGAEAAQDPAVVYAGSGDTPSVGAIVAMQEGLNRAASISDVGVSAGQAIGELLSLMREKAVTARGARAADKPPLNHEYQELLRMVDRIAQSASFQGVKVVDGSSSADLQVKTDLKGESQISVTGKDFTTAGPMLGLAGTDLLGAPDDLAAVLGKVDAASAGLGAQLAQMKAQSDQIQTHLSLVGQLQNALGGATQRSLDVEGARLQALQAQQLLAGQSGGVANQAPQALLSMFRS